MTRRSEFSSMTYRLITSIWLIVFTLTLLLSGCKPFDNGGSADTPPSPNPPVDTPAPIANQSPVAGFSAAPGSGEAPLAVSFDAGASSDADGSVVSYAWNFGDGGSASGETVSHTYTTTGTYTVTLTVTDDDGDSNTQSRTINVTATASLPPDPTTTAPSIDTTKPASVFDVTAFLYTGSNPVQTGVAEGTIVEHRAAVLRGKIMDRGGQPLPGVTVTILDHPELGQTLTRENGLFDLAVNGGGHLTVNYHKTGYLVAQRRIKAPWNDYAWLPDVVLVALTPESSTLDLASSDPVQIVQGPEVSDERGTRRTTLLVPRGINAQMLMPDGSTRNFSSNTLTVRATEFTVGENGPEAMPGELPPGVAYTYAVELSVDEAEAAGAASVQFDRPLYQYVENFVGFPVGDEAPHYYYNRLTGNWEHAEAGIVIKLLDTSTGMASIDSDGDDVAEDAATLSALGFTDDERTTLASLYSAGETLWRVPVTHFSPHDFNWYQRMLESQAYLREIEIIEEPAPVLDPCNSSGSIIECQNQVLGERVPVVGTPFTLNYRSSRMPGYKVDQRLRIRLFQSVPGNLAGIRLRITTAGQLTEVYYTAEQLRAMADYSYGYVWDGRDAYGRLVPGEATADISIGYEFSVPYSGCSGSGGGGAACPSSVLPSIVTINVNHKATLSGIDARKWGLGWTLSVNHSYSSKSQVLHKGNGRNQAALPIGVLAAGSYAYLSARFYDRCKDGEKAIGSCHLPTTDVAVGADGSLIIMDEGGGGESLEGIRIRKVDPQGIVSTVLTSGNPYDPQEGDVVFYPSSIAVGHDNSIYVGECGRVLRITANGEVSVFAGGNTNDTNGFSGEGGLATAAQIGCADDIAVGPDGSLYIADNVNSRVFRVNRQGIIRTVAGGGNTDTNADGIPATDIDGLGNIKALAVAEDGSLYLGMYDRIRKIDPTGIIRTIAGNGVNTVSGDGGPALQAGLGELQGLAIGGDGSLYVSSMDWSSDTGRAAYLRKISPKGIINELPGTSVLDIPGDAGYASSVVGDIEVGPDGGLHVAMRGSYLGSGGVYRFRTAGPSRDYRLIASDSGDEIYRFEQGLHRATLSARTGAELYRFGYDDARHLVSITDGSGNITRIERDSDGMLSAIVAPGGQRTTVSTDDNDFLASISNPQGETWAFGYSEDGLLLQSTDPNKGVSTYAYNDSGQLIENENPAGGGNTLTRTMVDSGVLVTRTSAEGVVYSYNTRSSGDSVLYINQGCCGASSTTITADGVSHFTLNDGSSATSINDADARRFGNQAPYLASLRLETPAGRSYEMRKTISSTLEDWSDPLSMVQRTETTLLPDSATSWSSFTRVYDAATGEETQTTAEGRQSVTTYDELGRVIMHQTGNLATQAISFDSAGRVASITAGSDSEARDYAFTYHTDNTLASVSDASGSVMQLTQDDAGRVTGMDLPGGRSIGFGYDAKGKLTELTTPGGATHSIGYSAMGQMTSYTPPTVTGAGTTSYAYDLDSRLSRISRPDGIDVDFTYDENGRLSTIVIDSDSITLDQDPDGDHLNAITAIDGGTLSFDYDGPLLVSSQWAGAINGQVTFDYGLRFEPVSSTVNGTTLNYGYDQDGLLISSGALSITRDLNNGFVSATELGNITDSRAYNNFGELSAYTASNGSSDLYSTSYSHDALGRITQKVETIAGVSHTYDYSYNVSGWLSEVQTDGVVTESYDYDLNGNRTNVSNSAGTASASFDAQDRMTSLGNTSYQYGPAGELESRTSAGQTTAYTYDVFGNLRNVSLPDGRNIEYLVDGMNRRIGRKVNGALTHGWLYRDQLNPIAELDGNGDLLSRFIYGSRGNVPDYMVKAGITYRIISDHLGSVRLVVNASDGSIIQRIDYDAFGRVLNDSNPGFQPFGFAGGLYDPDTGLVRFGVRDYDPEAGRWTAKDPVKFMGGETNLYSYVSNDPVNLIDPSGYSWNCFWDRVWRNVRTTNQIMFGSLFGGASRMAITIGSGAGGIVANAVGGVTLGHAATAVISVGAPAIGEAAIAAGSTAAITAGVVSIALEGGIIVGAIINTLLF